MNVCTNYILDDCDEDCDGTDCHANDGVCGKPATHFIPPGTYERKTEMSHIVRGLSGDGEWLCADCYDEWVEMFGENWKQFETGEEGMEGFFRRAKERTEMLRKIDRERLLTALTIGKKDE